MSNSMATFDHSVWRLRSQKHISENQGARRKRLPLVRDHDACHSNLIGDCEKVWMVAGYTLGLGVICQSTNN
jgi:hypothetical protein